MGSQNQDYRVCMGKKTEICKGLGRRGDNRKGLKYQKEEVQRNQFSL
jgi:hypothetical protein